MDVVRRTPQPDFRTGSVSGESVRFRVFKLFLGGFYGACLGVENKGAGQPRSKVLCSRAGQVAIDYGNRASIGDLRPLRCCRHVCSVPFPSLLLHVSFTIVEHDAEHTLWSSPFHV